MANWLLDYIEMTEYIPPEFRDQSFSMRELDLKVSIAMTSLDNEIKEFFSKIDSLSPQDKQEQYEALLKKYEEASQVASTKIKIADRLHDLVEKSMRLLDQGLEKLKEDLIEGDKAYIVEDIERRSQELDEQLKLEEEVMLQRQRRNRDSKTNHSKSSAHMNHIHSSNYNHRHSAPSIHQIPYNHDPNTQPPSMSSQHATITNHHIQHHHHHTNRSRNNSIGGQMTTLGRQKKRERKRLNSAMTIFNRNSKTDEDSTNQSFLASPTTPEYLAGLHSSNSNSLNDVSGGDTSCLTLKGMMANNRGQVGPGEKINGYDTLSKARQPILTAKDAVHAVSPNPTNSDKLISFSSNPNGDTIDSSFQHNNNKEKQNNTATHISLNNRNHRIFTNNQTSHLSNHLLVPMGLNNSGHNLLSNNSAGNNANNPAITRLNDVGGHTNRTAGSPFSSLTLSSRHDPLMEAASQAINETQNMTSGRRTSSLKASYAAVNSGRLPHPPSNHPMFDQANMSGKVYCKCRGTVHDINMIACDNGNCKYEWFHWECVGITTPPAGNWYCEDCRSLSGVQDRPHSSKQTKANSVATTT